MIASRVEKKYYDRLLSTIGTPSAGTITHLTTIPQGVGDTERVGDEIELRKMTIRLNLESNAQVGIVRFIFFQWIPSTTSGPTVADLLVLGASGAVDNTSQYRHDSRQSYRILYDRIWHLNGDIGVTNGQTTTSFVTPVFTIYPKRKKLEFIDSLTVYCASGIYLLSVGNASATCAGTFRSHYTDS